MTVNTNGTPEDNARARLGSAAEPVIAAQPDAIPATPVTDVPQIDECKRRYLAAVHAMQTGVSYVMHGSQGRGETSPKDLRVGVNSALVAQSAVVEVLLRKGIMSELEYWEALCTAMEAEAKAYRDRLREQFDGMPVTLR